MSSLLFTIRRADPFDAFFLTCRGKSALTSHKTIDECISIFNRLTNQSMEKQRDMKQHVSFVGALHVGFGILGVLGALAVYITFHFAHGFLESEPLAEGILLFIGNTLSLVILFFACLGVIGGIGLFSYRPWARIIVMIVSAINCLNIPIGTAKGVYSIWVLMQPETIEMFEGQRS